MRLSSIDGTVPQTTKEMNFSVPSQGYGCSSHIENPSLGNKFTGLTEKKQVMIRIGYRTRPPPPPE